MEGRRLKLSPVCTNCREKHLRCDGAPQCSRCRRSGAECIFVPSRRGMRPNRTPSTRAISGVLDGTLFRAASGSSKISSISSSPSPHHKKTASSRRLSSVQQEINLPTVQGPTPPSTIISERLIGLFYSRFLQAQPFIVPQHLLLEKHGDPAVYFLVQVIEYIGSNYCSPNSSLLIHVPDPTTLSQRLPKNAYTVQALLLLALRFEMVHQQAQYVRHLHQARDCALAIGMDHIDYASANSEDFPPLEQSWSSTWQVLLRMCQPTSFTADQQLQLPVEGHFITRRMTAPLPIAIEAQSWDWAETYAGQSAYDGYQPMNSGQLHVQNHAQSLPAIYDTSGRIPEHANCALSNLPLTTTWEDPPATTTTATAFSSNIESWPS